MTLKGAFSVARKLSTALALFVAAVPGAYAQVTSLDLNIPIKGPDTSFYMIMGGSLDGENTFSYPGTRTFQPMQQLVISNHGETVVTSPRLTINNTRNWFDFDSMSEECFAGATTEKEMALALWKFMRDKRVHYYESQPGNEQNDPIKLLGVYGYGMCYNSNYANAFLAKGRLQTYKSLSNRHGRHFVSQLSFGSEFMLVDSDLETFYLKTDNETVASYQDVIKDRNLVKRSQHYGKSAPFLDRSPFIAYSIYWPKETLYNFGMLKKFHTLDFSLRPGESIQYDWAPGSRYHQYGTSYSPPSPSIVANGKFVFTTNFRNAPLSNLLDAYEGIQVSMDPTLPAIHSIEGSDTSRFVVKVQSPFVIVGGEVNGRFVRQAKADKLRIYFSRDSVEWLPIWQANQTGEFENVIDLSDEIGTLTSNSLYKYFLQFEMAANIGTSCGVDSLAITTHFQVSRSFLPELHLGKNLIKYADQSDERDLTVSLQWQESTGNTPPAAVQAAGYPANGAEVDDLRLAFTWPEAVDADGSIVDYEFILSDRPDMRFPLSPALELYTSTINDAALNRFEIPFDGMLNNGQTYYWKVRAKDQQGAWSKWSPVWSFTPHGPRPVTNLTAVVESNALKISWETDPSGTQPVAYELHASKEALGFTPVVATMLTNSLTENSVSIALDAAFEKPFYRIVAIDAGGARSAPSNVVTLPEEFPLLAADTLMLGEPVAFSVPKIQTVLMDAVSWLNGTYFYFPTNLTMNLELLERPEWLEYDSANSLVHGVPDPADLYKMQRDSVPLLKVRLSNEFTGLQYLMNFYFPVQLPPNEKPAFSSIDTTAYAMAGFYRTLYINDTDEGDVIGDTKVLVKPSWLTANVQPGDTVIDLSGLPQLSDVGESLLTIRTSDIYGSVAKTYKLAVLDTITPITLALSYSVAIVDAAFTTALITSRPVNGLTFELVDGPAWLSFNPGTGTLTGTPRPDDLGEADVAIRSEDAGGRVLNHNVHIRVVGVGSARISGHEAICRGEVAKISLTFTGEPPWDLVYKIGEEQDTVRGLMTGIYEFQFSPLQNVTYTLVGAVGFAGDAQLEGDLSAEVQVHGPELGQLQNTEARVGQNFVSTIDVNDKCNGSLEYKLSHEPEWLNVDRQAGTLSGVPPSSSIGTVNFFLDIVDAFGTIAHIPLSIEVSGQPTVSAARESGYRVCFGDSATVKFQLTGVPPWKLDIVQGTTPYTIETSDPMFELRVQPLPGQNFTLTMFSDRLSDGEILVDPFAFDVVESQILIVSPNPFTQEATIELVVCRPGTVTLDVYNSMGGLAMHLEEVVKDGRGTIEWSTSELSPGPYFVIMNVNDNGTIYFSSERVIRID